MTFLEMTERCPDENDLVEGRTYVYHDGSKHVVFVCAKCAIDPNYMKYHKYTSLRKSDAKKMKSFLNELNKRQKQNDREHLLETVSKLKERLVILDKRVTELEIARWNNSNSK